jgi:inosine/xanthosine triphosphatase
LQVVVGSKNKIKLQAVTLAFKRLGTCVDVVGVSVKTSIPPQPIGIDDTVKGAIERASKALGKESGAVLGVGIEAGLVSWGGSSRYLDQHVVAIKDRRGSLTFGGSPAFECPPRMTSSVLERRVELDTVFEETTGLKKIGRSTGIIGFLSGDKVMRKDLIEEAVLMALIPWFWPSDYGVQGFMMEKKEK